MTKDFIALADFSGDQLAALIDRTIAEKPAYLAGDGARPLAGRTLAMVFEKPSLRTRVSFEVSMNQLGGSALYCDNSQIGIGTREAPADIARVLGRMCDGIMARTYKHELITELAAWSPGPIINGLSDYSHPCQAMADLTTVKEHFDDLKGRTLVFVGDGNNVARSLAVGCAKLGLRFILASPKGYELDNGFLERVLEEHPGADGALIRSPTKAVANADVIYADTWVSMGQEGQKERRVEAFLKYQINDELMAAAPDHAIVLHCLPAYRGYEITDEVFEAHAGTIFAEAENRLHFQRTLLAVLIGEGGIPD
ncbi:MAG: ornithine carbamoyltransferase [Planctomycetes bacterium]|jgi:ornithine carbamoyltransferase|nr:ornithine carbamoyltransferase [Planctomycetota bacterium]